MMTGVNFILSLLTTIYKSDFREMKDKTTWDDWKCFYVFMTLSEFDYVIFGRTELFLSGVSIRTENFLKAVSVLSSNNTSEWVKLSSFIQFPHKMQLTKVCTLKWYCLGRQHSRENSCFTNIKARVQIPTPHLKVQTQQQVHVTREMTIWEVEALNPWKHFVAYLANF